MSTGPPGWTPFTDVDRDLLIRELGRPPRGVLAVPYRCDHEVPAVVQTAPRLPDGTPFPTMFYLCCAALNAAVSRMESVGVMREMTAELAADPDLAAGYLAAHESYLHMRNELDDLGIAVTAGGMPDRVKCLHVLVAHSLAMGRGVNPLGDRAVDALPDYFRGQPACARLDQAHGSVPPRLPSDQLPGPIAAAEQHSQDRQVDHLEGRGDQTWPTFAGR